MIAKRTEKMRVIAKAFNMGTVGLIPRGRVVIANSVLSSQLTHVLSCAQGMTKKKTEVCSDRHSELREPQADHAV